MNEFDLDPECGLEAAHDEHAFRLWAGLVVGFILLILFFAAITLLFDSRPQPTPTH